MYTLITLTLLVGVITLLVRNRRLHRHMRELGHEFDAASIILESLNDGLIECDRDGVIVRMNHPAEKILGVEAASVVNRSFSDLAIQTPAEKLLTQVLQSPQDVKTGEFQSYSYEVYLDRPDVSKLRIYTIPKTDPASKNLLGYIKIVRDVTIETVVEAHKNDLVSIVSHQLLTPLTSAKWILKSLLDGDAGAITPKQGEMLRKGLVSNEQMVSLVSDILDLTKVEQAKFAYKFEPVDIGVFVHGLVESHREEAGAREINLLEQSEVASKKINLDKERMAIALSNLIENAIDYSPKGGSVSIKVGVSPAGVSISVSDHGIGVPTADQVKLFSKFYRAENAKRVRTAGTGLGLYLSKHIVEAHGGSVSYASKEGEGSTFKVNLLDAPPDPRAKSQPAFV